ncbi:hypothetical protein E0H70_05200 [Rhizobium leguminosarum bv. viciae]|nr:hypothetical protein E0H70_05200 [Rhizobium leguminosarum bv. viciae]
MRENRHRSPSSDCEGHRHPYAGIYKTIPFGSPFSSKSRGSLFDFIGSERRCALSAPQWPALEHDAEKCARFSDDIMLSLFNSEQDSDFRPNRPEIILF